MLRRYDTIWVLLESEPKRWRELLGLDARIDDWTKISISISWIPVGAKKFKTLKKL